jgi:hypothetical protein
MTASWPSWKSLRRHCGLAVAIYVLGLAPLPLFGEMPRLVSEMKALGLRFALLVESQAIDDAPVWSPDGRFLAIHLDQKWSALNVEFVALRMGTWHDRNTIAVAYPNPALQDVSGTEVRTWQTSARFDAHRLTTKTGVTIELAPEGLGTVFRVTSKGLEPEVLWKTSLESCHSLALSPAETLVAFLCKLNGLVVFVVPP